MKKLRVLFVMMLLAGSGAALAGDSENESGCETPKKTKTQKVKSAAKKSFSKTVRFITWPGRKLWGLRTVKEVYEEVDAMENLDEEQKVTEKEERVTATLDKAILVTGYATSAALAVALIYTIRNKRVQEGVKGLVRGVRRTFGRTQAAEKRTDGQAIEKSA